MCFLVHEETKICTPHGPMPYADISYYLTSVYILILGSVSSYRVLRSLLQEGRHS